MGKKAGKIALGLGIITGALTGFLLAPEEGKEVRKKIAKRDTKGLVHDLKIMGDEIADVIYDLSKRPSVVEALETTKDKIADVANLQREELDKMLKEANKKAEKFKKGVAKYVREQKALLDKKTKKKKKKTTKKRKTTAKKTTKKKPTTTKKKK